MPVKERNHLPRMEEGFGEAKVDVCSRVVIHRGNGWALPVGGSMGCSAGTICTDTFIANRKDATTVEGLR